MAHKFQETPIESSLPSPWCPESAGEFIDVEYLATEEIPSPQRDRSKKEDPGTFTSYRGRLVSDQEGMFGAPEAKRCVKKEGEIVSFSGGFLGTIMNQVPVGGVIRVRFEGRKKHKGNDAKMYTVFPSADTKLIDPYDK